MMKKMDKNDKTLEELEEMKKEVELRPDNFMKEKLLKSIEIKIEVLKKNKKVTK